ESGTDDWSETHAPANGTNSTLHPGAGSVEIPFHAGGDESDCRPAAKMTKTDVEIYDTTLRDGSQGEGINFSVTDKLRIAERIDLFGIHYIEGGWPGSNPKDIEFFTQARRKKFKRARLAAFGATRRKGVAVENDPQVRLLLEAETPVVTIVGKTWLLHVKEVLRTTPEENLAMIGDTIRYVKNHGKFVIYDAEHSFDGFSD